MYIRFSTITLLLLLLVSSCRDEEICSPGMNFPEAVNANSRSTNGSGGLTQNADGTWTANQRVPLVGEGRIIDDLSSALIQVINTDRNINNLLDTNLDNSASFSGIAGVDAIGNQIASIMDVNRTYAGGQDAGFVYKVSDNSLLTASVLKGFWIATYLNGQQQEMKGGDPDVTTLQLNLISAANNDGKQTISISTQFEKPFDEIKIGIRGVDVKVLQSLKLYYGFVGENAILPSTPSNFPGVKIHQGVTNWTNGFFQLGANKLVNESLTDYVTIELLGSLVQPFVTVDFGETIPAGSEVGFCTSSFNVLQLGLFGTTKLSTFDDEDNEVENVTVGNLLGLSAVAGGDGYISLITKEPCSQVKLGLYGLNVKLGGTLIRYAYVRPPVTVDPTSRYSLSDATVTASSYHFHIPENENGTVSFSLINYPSGANPVMEDNLLKGMSLPGQYVVQATYTSPDGETYIQTVTVTRKETPSMVGCNNLITIADYPDIELGRSSSISGGCLLCVAEGTNNAGFIIDVEPDNYASYYNVLSLAANTHVTGIKAGKTINSDRKEVRVGFTFQPTSTLLSADALKYFIIKLFKDGVEVKSSEVDHSSVVTAGVANGEETRLRMSVNTNEAFDAIELWTAGVLNLNLNSFRLYNAFWEPTTGCQNIESSAEACIEMITPGSHGAHINYNATGVAGAAAVSGEFISLSKVLDDDKETCGTLTVTDAIGATTLAVGFDALPAYQTVGFIIQAPDYVADVNLLNAITLSVYKNGQKLQTSADDAGLLGLGVISYGGKKYIEMTPTIPYDEVRITFAAVAELLRTIYVYGAFTRMDTNGNGIPDCAETTGETEEISTVNATPHVCLGEDIELYATGGTIGKNYRLRFYNYADGNSYQDFIKPLQAGNKFVLTGIQPGDYYISIADEGGITTFYSGVHVTVHPSTTTWKTNAATTDWNDWYNWTAGTPWDCTDVVIPEGCTFYPVLKQGEDNYCARIRFCPQSEVVNTQYLHYSSAWVDLRMDANRYYLLSMPLKETYSGDLFLAAGNPAVTEDFPVLTEENYPQNRFNPNGFQRIWNQSVTIINVNGQSQELKPGTTLWSDIYNTPDESYLLGKGFSFQINNGNLPASTGLVFRLPKQHTSYNYYTPDTHQPSTVITPASINRRTNHIGRFIYENDNRTAPATLMLTLTGEKLQTHYLLGNPFMAHLDIAKLIAGNSNIKAVKRYGGETENASINVNSIISRYSGLIAPTEAFFIVTRSAGNSVTLKLDKSMIYQGNGFQ